MAGIYIHIPFCRRKCHYCNFFSLASVKFRDPFLKALRHEIVQTKGYLEGNPVKTLYFGGGTPSLFHPAILQELLELVITTHSPDHVTGPAINQLHHPDAEQSLNTVELRINGFSKSNHPENIDNRLLAEEITLEMNPDDLTQEYLIALKQTRINRISLGVQSFDDSDLTYLNRSHSAEQAQKSIRMIQEAGFENINIDLIYGLPSSSEKGWEKNLETAFSLNVPHISSYALTVEQGTPLAWMIDRKKSLPVVDDEQAIQFGILMERAAANGYEHYEISNFAKPGHHAMHNTNYWQGVPYLGLGPSAHSYNGNSRRWNVSNLSDYIKRIAEGTSIFEEEILTRDQKFNEYVMTSLRTIWGCDSEKINRDFGSRYYEGFIREASRLVQNGLLAEHSGNFYLTRDGKFLADRVASDLFVTD